MQDKRSEKRNFFSVTMEYSLPAPEDCPDCNRNSAAITTNISRKGMGIYTDQPLREGQSISIISDKISDSAVSAEVRWCRRISNTLYRVGLMFIGFTVATA